MRRLLLLAALICCFGGMTSAQPLENAPKVIGKFGALSLLDPLFPSVNLGAEFQLGGPWYGQLEGGLVLNVDDWAEGLVIEDKSGFRLRPAIRYYYKEQRNRYFMELLFVYRQVNMDLRGDFRIVPEVGPSYNQRINYSVDSRKYSFLLNIGFFEYSPNERFVFEVGMGLGGASQDNDYSGIPDNASLIQTSNIQSFDPDYETTVADFRATGMLYFNLGYVLY
ncbi:MAG: hypothetical protein KI786_05580 [Mameliella sp.]|nr:hypothetical protein [Phaeodactylibacter sp.]